MTGKSSLRPSEFKPGPKHLFGRFDARQAVKLALSHPLAVPELFALDRRVAKALQVSLSRIKEYRKQLIADARLPERGSKRLLMFGGFSPGRPSKSVGPTKDTLYIIVRLLRPKVVVETGVAAGFSTSYTLRALHDNGFGKLVSIDLPTTDRLRRLNEDGILDETHVAFPDQTGFAIPSHLRDRWTFLVGDSKSLLQRTLSTYSSIDRFFSRFLPLLQACVVRVSPSLATHQFRWMVALG